jgi:acetaldehyde dehydrogenase (acetylating)
MVRKKIQVAILGSGNVGSDLLMKIQRSPFLSCSLFIGKNPDSPGLARAREMGVPTSHDSIGAIVRKPAICDIVFDATSAAGHRIHAPILKKLKKFTVDLTPSKVGLMCVPAINLAESIKTYNVNMISCGGQANTPLIFALMKLYPRTPYIEVVSSIASKSAGDSTRDNIDEYTQTTSEGIQVLTGVAKTKTIIVLNPADPPIDMHNTIYARIDDPDMEKISRAIGEASCNIQKYVPGFRVTVPPVFENNRVTMMTEVVGLGDFLPVYAGNLDIINCAAVIVAEAYAKKKLKE